MIAHMQPIMASIARARAKIAGALSPCRTSQAREHCSRPQKVICRALVDDFLPIISSTDIGRRVVLRAALVFQRPSTCHKNIRIPKRHVQSAAEKANPRRSFLQAERPHYERFPLALAQCFVRSTTQE
jgi:hypothetical protein